MKTNKNSYLTLSIRFTHQPSSHSFTSTNSNKSNDRILYDAK